VVYKRKGGKSLYFMARLPGRAWKQLSTGTPNRPLANRIAAMWETLAVEHRAWDLLERVLKGSLTIGQLYDLWTATLYNPVEMRRGLNDQNLEPLVTEWHGVHRRGVDADSAQHALTHVRALLPAGTPCPVSAVTTEWLTRRLSGYTDLRNAERAVKRNTLRKVHSSWSVFFQYATDIQGLFPANPMDRVTRPRQEKPPIQFFELDEIERIVGHQPTEMRRVLYTVLYGTGLEVGVVVDLHRMKVLADKTIVGAGTKAHTRNRPVRVDDWAWPAIEKYVADLLPYAEMFPGLNRWTTSDWHRETVKALKLPAYPLKNARHSWAVRNLRAGVPIHVVQQQLGHGTAKLTLDTYGQFIPSGIDRDAAAKKVTEYEERRRGQK
jgi:integrase